MRTKQEAHRLLKAQNMVEQIALKHNLSDQAFADVVELVDDLLKAKRTAERVQVRFHNYTGYYWVVLDGYCYSSALIGDLATRQAAELLSLLDRGVTVEVNAGENNKYTAKEVA